VNYLRRYRIKIPKFWLVVFILLFIIALATLAVNIFLSLSKDKLTLPLQKYLAQKVIIGRILYLPPNFVILREVTFQENAHSTKSPALFSRNIGMKFSLLKIAINKRLSVSDIYIQDPRVNYYALSLFLKDNFKQIMVFIRSLPKQDINFFVNRMFLDLSKEDNGSKYISADFSVAIKDNSISSVGSVDINTARGSLTNVPLRYNLQVILMPGGFSVEKLELMRENFCSQLKGSYVNGNFRLSGLTFMNTIYKEGDSPATIGRQAGFSFTSLPQANLFILDIDAQGNFTFPKLEIEHLKFSINNNPVSLNGSVVFLGPVSLDLSVSTLLTSLKYQQQEDIKKVDLKFKGTLKENVFESSGTLNLESVKKRKGGVPLEKMEIGFKGLSFYFAQFAKFKMHLDESDLFFKTKQNEYKFSLKNLFANIYLKSDKYKAIEYTSLFYDGLIKGWGKFDITKWPPVVKSAARLTDVSADKLDGLLVHFSKFHSKLSSQMYFNSSPRMSLKGTMLMQNGYLENLQFFRWLADFFDLPSLKKIHFSKSASKFLVNEEGVSLRDIDLKSKDVNLKGFFGLGHSNLVSSTLSLSLSRKLMKESAKFTPLFNLLGKDFNSLIFDFQLSGSLHKMNFYWLQSDFKRKIQASIPNFIERKIDRDIEKVIENIQSQ